MLGRRTLHWATALRDMRADRTHFASGERQAYVRQQAFAKLATSRASAIARVRPLFGAGAYNRQAIMGTTIEAAKARRAVTGEAWRVCLSAALTGTWRAAKAASRQLKSGEHYHLERLREEMEVYALQVTKAVRGEANGSQDLEDASPAPPKHVRSEYGLRGGFCVTEPAQAFPNMTAGSAPARK